MQVLMLRLHNSFLITIFEPFGFRRVFLFKLDIKHIQMKIFLVALLVFFFEKALAQSSGDTLTRYDKSIKYLTEHNSELKNKWLSLFSGSNKRDYKKKIGKEFKYKISSIICFLPILIFKDEINNLDSITGHQILEVKEPSIYLTRFGFNSFTSNYLLDKRFTDTITSVEEGMFIISLSKPINNYLIAEISGHVARLKRCDVKIMGRTMWMLFIFSKEEQLIRVYYSYFDR